MRVQRRSACPLKRTFPFTCIPSIAGKECFLYLALPVPNRRKNHAAKKGSRTRARTAYCKTLWDLQVLTFQRSNGKLPSRDTRIVLSVPRRDHIYRVQPLNTASWCAFSTATASGRNTRILPAASSSTTRPQKKLGGCGKNGT